MTDDDMELIFGSGNVFRDFGDRNPDLEQLRALLAAQVVRVLDARDLSVRAAAAETGFAAADFSRVRNARLERFTVDRLMIMLQSLDQNVDVSVTVRPREPDAPQPSATSE